MSKEASSSKITDFSNSNQSFSKVEIPYDILVEQNEAGIFLLENNIISYANTAFLEVIGVERNELVGSSILDWIADVDYLILESGLEDLISGKTDRFSEELRSKDEASEIEYFSLHLKVLSRGNDVVKISGASRDATSRVLKNIELTQTKSMYDSLYHNTVEGVLIYDYARDKMIEFNKQAMEILGYEKEENLLKQNRLDFVPQFSEYFSGVDCHEHTADHGRRIMNGEAFKTIGAFVKKDKTHIFVRASVVPTFRRYGEAFIFFSDITSRQLAIKNQKEAEKKYRDIFENSHEAIIYFELETKTPIICNDKALNLFGVSSFSEFLEYRIHDFLLAENYEEDPQRVYIKKCIEVAVRDGRSEFSHWIKTIKGEVVHISVVLIGDTTDPEAPKLISFIRDITHLHNAQVSLNEKNEELQKYINSNLQLENFAYFASHDLQTPLRSIISFTQLLQRRMKGRLSVSEQEYMDFIISSSKNMRGLVNDLLSYSRVNTTKINIKDVNLNELIHQLCQEMQTTIEEKNANIIISNIPSSISLDQTKIRQVFQNLITNALKFIKDDVRPEVVISGKEEIEHWTFFVKDNGIGISPEFQDKIFLLFKRLHGNAEYEGTGIGLAMVKKIIEQHEGEVWLESEEGKGATFGFSIKK